MSIERSALVLIDLQKESGFGLEGLDEAVHNSTKVIEACRANGIPVIYTRQINRADGIGLSKGEPLDENGAPQLYNATSDAIEIFDDIQPRDTDLVIDKYRWSAFFDTSLDLTLKSLGVTNLLIGGVVTDGCLMTSVFDAYFRDYRVHLIRDLCAASNEGAHMAALMMMANWVYNLEMYSADELIHRIEGRNYQCWTSDTIDSLQFTPETMREQFAKLISATSDAAASRD